jgi:hypothetical protein
VKLDTSVWHRRGHARGRCLSAIGTMLVGLAIILGSGSGRTGTMASASPITPKNTDLLVFDIAVDSSSFVAPMDWKLIDEASVPGDSTERAWYQIASSGAPQLPMVTVQSGHAWDAVIAAFKVAP